MIKEENFTLMKLQEFELWLSQSSPVRMISHVQQHHTSRPSYSHFTGSNHFELQIAIRNYHIWHLGFREIGQHFTTFPDGQIMTGRSIERNPACIKGQNLGGICMEHLGNFDLNEDEMTVEQKETIIRMTTSLCMHFNLALNTDTIVYHHWFDLDTGMRNNGSGNNKTCPGTNFFGGNTPEDCRTYFLPLLGEILPSTEVDT